MRTSNNINLDSRLNKILSARASMEHKTVEDYTNQLLMMYFSIPFKTEEKEEKKDDLFSLSELRGILHDDGEPLQQTKLSYMEEKYGKL